MVGDSDATLQLVKKLTPKAHAVAWRILGNRDDAEDVLQDAFIRLFKVAGFQGKSSLDTYFYKIVTRLCFDQLKKKHNDLSEFSDDEVVEGGDVLVEVRQTAKNIQQAIQLLNPRQRIAISLWAYMDADVVEIAEILGIDRNAAHQLLHRAKTNLKKLLELTHVE